MTAGKDAKVSDLFRFGMRLVMPKSFDRISYYGRGPGENYADRNHNTGLGIYNQSVEEQFYPYIRPQENGTRQTSAGGNSSINLVADWSLWQMLLSLHRLCITL